MDILSLLIAFATAFCAAFVGTNTGGGAFIVIPVLIFLGLPPHIAVASNRVSVVAAASAGMFRFHKERKIRFEVGIPVALFSAIGAFIGANAMLQVSEDFLRRLIGISILLILVILIVRPNHGLISNDMSSFARRSIGYVLFSLVGFVASFLGGAGIFSRMIYMTFFGFTFLESAGTSKIATFTLSLVASFVFIRAGVVDWSFALALILGASLGSYTGAHHGLKKGDAWVRKLFIVVVLVSALRLLL